MSIQKRLIARKNMPWKLVDDSEAHPKRSEAKRIIQHIFSLTSGLKHTFDNTTHHYQFATSNPQ